MLLVPMTERVNFWATKLTSLVAFEQLNMPNVSAPRRSTALRRPSAAVSSAWWRCVNAIEADQSRQAVDALSSEFGNAKLAYETLSGTKYPFDCPMPARR